VSIYPLVADDGNERVLTQWLDDHDTYTLADLDKAVTDATFDLCIVDSSGLQRFKDELVEVKSGAEPVLLPVLLLVPESREEIIEFDQGEIADNVLTTAIDEIVSLPMRQAELEWRIRALLRLRKQSQELRTKSDKLRQFKEAVKSSGHAIFITDPDGTLEYVNPAFEEITGYDQKEVLGETPSILKSGENSETFYERLWETISGGDVWESEIVDKRKDGTHYTAYQTIAPILNDDEITAYVAVQTDMTERKELRDRLKRHRDIVQRIEDPIMLQDESGAFELVNEALTEFAGVSEEALLGEDETLFMDEASATRIEEKKRATIETGSPSQYSIAPDFERSNKDAIFDTRRYPYYDKDGELFGTVAICRDVTDLEERTRQLRVLDNILRHNLRNDLTVIRGLADQIREDSSKEAAGMAAEIVTQSEALIATGEKSRSITEILSQEIEHRSIDIAASIRSVADDLRASNPDVQLDVTVPDRAVASTTLKIRKAIEELLRNAIIHNDHDEPTIEMRVESGEDTVEISVIDDGPGMSEMDRDVLETGQALDELYHGSGLGLWLVYWIVKRSNGSVTVTDANLRGMKVTITLPSSER
jgi:PAS domain S-box-containing protein